MSRLFRAAAFSLSIGVACSPSGAARMLGADVSHYQTEGGISQTNWNAFTSAGKSFVFIKATEGLTGPDDTAMTNNVARATNAGLLVGVYHYAHPENRPTPAGAVLEANHLLSYAGNAIGPGRLRPALDLEGSAANLSGTALTDWVIAFSDAIVAARGESARPIIYCNQSFANYLLDSRLSSYDLWLRDITANDVQTTEPPTNGYPRNTGSFDQWTFWQYSASGSAGAISPLDLNVQHSEYKTLNSLLIPEPSTFGVCGLSALAATKRVRRRSTKSQLKP